MEAPAPSLGAARGSHVPFLLIADGGRRLGDVNRIGGREGILQAPLQGLLQTVAPLGWIFPPGLLACLALCDGLVAAAHGFNSCMITINTRDGPGVPRRLSERCAGAREER